MSQPLEDEIEVLITISSFYSNVRIGTGISARELTDLSSKSTIGLLKTTQKELKWC